MDEFLRWLEEYFTLPIVALSLLGGVLYIVKKVINAAIEKKHSKKPLAIRK